MSNEKMREEFEKAYPLEAGMHWNEVTQSYAGHTLFWLWMDRLEVWTASRAALRVELPYMRMTDGSMQGKDVISAIESTGVRTK